MAWFKRGEAPPPPANPTKGGSPASEDVSSLIGSCCREQLTGVLVCTSLASFANCRFLRMTTQGILVELESAADAGWFPPLSMAIASFNIESRAVAFLAPVLESLSGEGGASGMIWLGVPDSVARAEGRLVFRVPLSPHTSLEAIAVFPDGRQVKVRPRNISFSGILVQFPPDVGSLPLGTNLEILLRLGKESVQIEAVVRRQNGPQEYGLFFPATVRRGGLNAPPALRQIVKELEGYWLRVRDVPT